MTKTTHIFANVGERRPSPVNHKRIVSVRVSIPPNTEDATSCLKIFYKITDAVLICCGIIIIFSCFVSIWIGLIAIAKRMGWNPFGDHEKSFELE